MDEPEESASLLDSLLLRLGLRGPARTRPVLSRLVRRGSPALDERHASGPGRRPWGLATGVGQKIRMMSTTMMAIATIAPAPMYTPPGRPRLGRPPIGSRW
jgi:hypothetical protein